MTTRQRCRIGKIFCAVCSMIRHKNIFIKNIYYMLAYAFTNLKFDEIKNVAAEEFDNIHNLFAAILSKGIGRQLKQGLYREYLSRTENLSTLRGKIEMSGTIKNLTAGRRKIFCNYDELSENNLLNQILKTTAILLLRHKDVDEKYKSALKKEILFFSNVEKILPTSINWEKIYFLKNNRSYEMLINICRLILEGMLQTEDAGEYKLKSFLDEKELSWLYEKFLLAYYRKHFPQIKTSATQISWALDDGYKNLLPTMKTDVTLSHGEKILIIDAKFYSHTTQKYFDAHKIHSGNLYQIFTYVKNLAYNSDKKISGMLLYARTDDEIQPDIVYQMSGNKIGVKTLDLNKNFSEIANRLNAIAENHFAV